MKSIFITIPWFHPAYKAGGPVQSIANLVNEFKENVAYYIFCGNTDLNNTKLENIETGKWTRYNAHTQVWYAAQNKRSETIVDLIGKIKPDIVFIVGIFSWHFNMVPLLFGKAGHKIISVRGMLHKGALSQKKNKKKIFLSLWKLMNWHKKATFHVTNEEEKKEVENCFGDEADIFIAGNYPRRFNKNKTFKKPGHIKLITVALISPMKNHLLILEALEQTPAIIEYHICGPVKDMEYWQKCLEQMKQLPVNVSVVYHGEIMPESVEGMLQMSHVFIMPSKSENFGHAIYESLSAGKPVITSHHTPWQNLKEHTCGLNVNNDVNKIAEAIIFFAAMTQQEYEVWSLGAIDYAEKAFDSNLLNEQYTAMFSVEE